MNEFTPLNELEKSLVAAREDKLPIEKFIRRLAHTTLALPSAGEVHEDGSGYLPILFDKHGTELNLDSHKR